MEWLRMLSSSFSFVLLCSKPHLSLSVPFQSIQFDFVLHFVYLMLFYLIIF